MASLTLSTSASEVLLPNRNRKSFAVGNEDSAIAIFLKYEKGTALSVSSTDHDFRLGPGEGVGLNAGLDGDEHVKGRWTAVAASGTPRVSVFESEDIRR